MVNHTQSKSPQHGRRWCSSLLGRSFSFALFLFELPLSFTLLDSSFSSPVYSALLHPHGLVIPSHASTKFIYVDLQNMHMHLTHSYKTPSFGTLLRSNYKFCLGCTIFHSTLIDVNIRPWPWKQAKDRTERYFLSNPWHFGFLSWLLL